jgi:hypothetical protein
VAEVVKAEALNIWCKRAAFYSGIPPNKMYEASRVFESEVKPNKLVKPKLIKPKFTFKIFVVVNFE